MDAASLESQTAGVLNSAAGWRSWRPRLAAILAMLAVAEAVGILLISSGGNQAFRVGLDLISIGFLANIVLFAGVGALIVRRRPETIVAWLMIAMGLGIGTGIFLYGYGASGMSPATSGTAFLATRPLALEAAVASQLFFLPALAFGTTLLLLLFPTDRLVDPRWRFVAIASAASVTAYDLAALFHPGELDHDAFPGLANPLAMTGLLGQLFGFLGVAGNLLATILVLLAAVSLVDRYRRADPVVAAQIRWVGVAAGLAAIALAASALLGSLDDLVFGVGIVLLACTPIAIGIAITRYRLYDIDRLINRALVYGSLSAILAGVFTAGIALAQRLFVAVTGQSSDVAIVLATLVVATLYAPLRKRLEAFVDVRFKYEQRRFGAQADEIRRVMAIIDPVRAAERLATGAVRELEAIGAAVVDSSGQVMATAGLWPATPAIELSFSRDDQPIEGWAEGPRAILVGPRTHGEPHDPVALADLQEFARLVAGAIRPGPT